MNKPTRAPSGFRAAWLASLLVATSSIGCTHLNSRLQSQAHPERTVAVSPSAAAGKLTDRSPRNALAPTSPQPEVVMASASEAATPTPSSETVSRPMQQIPVSMASCGVFAHQGCDPATCATAGTGGAACSCCAGSCPPGQPACRPNAQEYIFDGGDQQPTVVVNQDWTALGIDPTDTVAYYETVTGELCVQPSNRVPIYAPRFGAVRQVSGAELAVRAVGPNRILAPVAPGRLDDAELAGAVVQPVPPLGQQQVSLIEAFRERTAGTPMEAVLPPLRMSEALVPFEDIEVLPTGLITDDEIAVMGRILQNAQAWYHPENLGVLVDNQAAVLLIDSQRPLGVHVYDIPGKCSLRVCKTASHTIANSGDIVNFTIRFDNVGAKPVGNVVLVDSLSPRLEYIEGSQQSSVAARFSAEPNDVGSQVLRWELESPVEEQDGGVVSFDCLVR